MTKHVASGLTTTRRRRAKDGNLPRDVDVDPWPPRQNGHRHFVVNDDLGDIPAIRAAELSAIETYLAAVLDGLLKP